jgi:hypothetical protein
MGHCSGFRYVTPLNMAATQTMGKKMVGSGTHSDIVLLFASSVISVLISVIFGGIWILLKRENRRNKIYALIVAIAAAFMQLILYILFHDADYIGGLLFTLLILVAPYTLGPSLIGIVTYAYLVRNAKEKRSSLSLPK